MLTVQKQKQQTKQHGEQSTSSSTFADKLGFRDEMATKAWMLFNRAVEEVNSGKLKWKEIAEVIKEDYGYEIEEVT